MRPSLHDAMDRPIDSSVIRQRTRKRIIQGVVAVCVLTAGFFLLSAWIAPSVPRNQIRTAIVDSGLVEATISSSGSVVPEFEEVISSPTDTRVLQILKRPGENLSKGDQFLVLDISESKLALERVEKDLSLKANHATQLKLDQGNSLTDLESQLHIKQLRLTYLKSKTAQQQKMYEIGANSKDQLEQTKLEEEIATTEQAGLEQTIRNAKQSLENQLAALATEIGTLKKEKVDIQRQLGILSCRASAQGVLTMVAQEIGATIHRGEIIARLANLTAYRVEAVVSDIHSGTIATGQQAHIFWNGGAVDGVISNIYPSIENGTMKFSITLDDRADPRLRSNLRVDIAVITAQKGMALRVARGPFLMGSGPQEVFVVRGERGVRTTATIGVAGFDYVEVLNGLEKGDEIVISDMRDFLHLKEIRLR